MTRNRKSRLFLNFKILIGAFIIALAIFYISKNPSFFKASVLSLQEIQTIQSEGRDIAYKNQPNLLDIFLASGVVSPSSLDFSLVFDPSTEIQTQNLSGQGDISITDIASGSAEFHITNLQNIDYTQSILLVSFTGTNETANYLIIDQAIARFADGSDKNLSIGNLGEKLFHNK